MSLSMLSVGSTEGRGGGGLVLRALSAKPGEPLQDSEWE